MQMDVHVAFAQQLSTFGADLLPPDAIAAFDTWTAASNLRSDDPVASLRAAAFAGDLTADNVAAALADAAATLAAADRARGLVAELDHPLGNRFTAAVAQQADAIVVALAPRFDEAADALTAAAQVIPDGATAETIIGLGPSAVTSWHALANAASVLDAIAAIRSTLARQYAYYQPAPAVAAFIGPAASAKDLKRADYLHHGQESRVDHIVYLDDNAPGGRWAHLARRGYTLRLNDAAHAALVASSQLDPEPVAA